MLNRVSGIFIGIFLTLFSFGLVIPATQAQESPTAGAATTAVLDPNNIVTFEQLSFTGQTLRGPSDSARLFLSLPADWQLLPGTQVELDTLVFISSEALSTGLGVYGGSIEVEFNDIVIGDIPLTQNGPATFTCKCRGLSRTVKTTRCQLFRCRQVSAGVGARSPYLQFLRASGPGRCHRTRFLALRASRMTPTGRYFHRFNVS